MNPFKAAADMAGCLAGLAIAAAAAALAWALLAPERDREEPPEDPR